MSASSVTERLDALYEFDREPVRPERLKRFSNFAGLYAGEHVAGTEFIIGPLFVSHGVAASDFFLGLISGNLLAVLCWAFLCAPVAVRTRLTFYWQLRRICGPWLNFAYCIINALMWCILAGAMIGVSATAVGLPFDMPMPRLTDFYPTSLSWIAVLFGVGAVVVVLAILGFERIAWFGKLCSPWMCLVFIAAALAVLPRLGCHSAGDFWRVANEKIWTGAPFPGQSKFTFWHVMFFSWFCNIAWHIGMGDMTILRYAQKWWYGFASFFGMFFGHFIAWICSGILCAAAQGEIAPGPIAYGGAGVAGAVCVVIAGWTTANPTLYRAGLAFQVVTPNWARWKVTLAAGTVTTVAVCFPALVMKLLDFVAVYGLILMPMGVVILADHWILPRLGLRSEIAIRDGLKINWAAAGTWIGTVAICAAMGIEIFFKSFPGILIALVLYLGLSALLQRRAPRAVGAS